MDPHSYGGYDNHAFESPARSRKTSGQTADHAEIGPVRKKSILHHALENNIRTGKY